MREKQQRSPCSASFCGTTCDVVTRELTCRRVRQIAMISPGLGSCEHSLNTLRYADRVKELGAQDPLEMKPGEGAPPARLPQQNGRRQQGQEPARAESHDEDLAQLRSLNVSRGTLTRVGTGSAVAEFPFCRGFNACMFMHFIYKGTGFPSSSRVGSILSRIYWDQLFPA